MWGRTVNRNMVAPEVKNLPAADAINAGEIDFDTEAVKPGTTQGVKWVAKLGSQAYGNPTIADGRVYIGTNNDSPRDPKFKGDRSTLYCLDEATGELIWQLNVAKLGAGKVSDWEYLGICSSAAVDGERVYIVTNLADVLCLDVHGMSNGNQGMTAEEEAAYLGGESGQPIAPGENDADILWRYDMRGELNVFPHNITSSSPLVVGDRVFVNTSNGVDWSHVNIVNPRAPTLIALDKHTGELVGEETAGISSRLMHSSWSSPAFAEVGEGEDVQPTVLFGAGDGFIYGFDPTPVEDEEGFGILPVRWKVDLNPAEYRMKDGEPVKYATYAGPSEVIATPVYHDGLVYIAIGQDPEHGEGVGALSAIDPTVVDDDGNAKVVWRDTTIQRTISTVAVHDGLLYAADYTGNVYCYDAKTGEPKWTHDTLAHIWASPLVADGRVWIGNEDGILSVLNAAAEKQLLAEVEFDGPIYSSPVAAHGVLYVATQTHLYAIGTAEE